MELNTCHILGIPNILGIPDFLGIPYILGIPDIFGIPDILGTSDILGIPDILCFPDFLGIPYILGIPDSLSSLYFELSFLLTHSDTDKVDPRDTTHLKIKRRTTGVQGCYFLTKNNFQIFFNNDII